MRKATWWILVLGGLISAVPFPQEHASQPPPRHVDLFIHTGEEGHQFPARILLPDPKHHNGFGILLLAGGYSNDLHWTVPGMVQQEGGRQQITMNGRDHQDGTLLAQSLAARGFVVMRYSTIRRDDPLADDWPQAGTVYSLWHQRQIAKAALAALRQRSEIDADRILLVAHSLGAVRAANIAAADEGLAGLVLMGAAQVTRTAVDDRGRNMNRNQAKSFLGMAGGENQDELNRTEYSRWQSVRQADSFPALAHQSFEQLDFDRDGKLRIWEISAGIARDLRRSFDDAALSETDPSGLFWTEDILARRRDLPTLFVYGSLDNAQGHHAPIIGDLIQQGQWPHCQVQVLPHLGHQLGREQGKLLGPIDSRVMQEIGEWLQRVINDQ